MKPILIDFNSKKIILPSVLSKESGLSLQQINYYFGKKGFVSGKTHYTLKGHRLKKFIEQWSIIFPELKHVNTSYNLYTEEGVKLILDYAMKSHISNYKLEDSICYFKSWFFHEENVSDDGSFMDNVIESLSSEILIHLKAATFISEITKSQDDKDKQTAIVKCFEIIKSVSETKIKEETS